MKQIGFKPAEHLGCYLDMRGLVNDINYYLKHEDERERIAKAGMQFVRTFHSNKVRVKQLMGMIREAL
jgi:spore maturation protein CgeB